MSARLAEVARQTLDIIHSGRYVLPDGSAVAVGDAVARAVAGTRLYLPDDALPNGAQPDGLLPAGARGDDVPARAQPLIEVTTESTVEAGRRLGPGTVALVFASARNPGGGFLTGARAQEEDIARASALYPCLCAVPDYYAHHRASRDLRYTDRVIYCPQVPVFRDHSGALLAQPYDLSFIVAAAPNLGAILSATPELADTVPAVLHRRAERVVRIAVAHGHRKIVLGAWGCGVFRNSPEVVAAAFRHALAQVPGLDHVVFAILDRTGDGPIYRTFADVFGPGRE